MAKKLYPLQVIPGLFTKTPNLVDVPEQEVLIKAIPSDSSVYFSLDNANYSAEQITAKQGAKIYYIVKKEGYQSASGTFILSSEIIEVKLDEKNTQATPQPVVYFVFADDVGVVDEHNRPILFVEN